MRQPNLFFAGAAKGGTTSIYDYLCEHPDIYMCPIKEPHFFCSDIRKENFTQPHFKKMDLDIKSYLRRVPLKRRHIHYIDDLRDYESLFVGADAERYLGECSGGYLYSMTAAQNIYDYNPDSKIVISLREPVDRAYSHWKMNLAAEREDESVPFIDCIEKEYQRDDKAWGVSHLYVDLGMYYEQIKRYMDLFPKENIHIVFYKDLVSSPQGFINDIFDFLEIDRVTINPQRKSNQSRRVRFPVLRSFVRKYDLAQYFSRDLVERLKALNSKDDFPALAMEDKKLIYHKYFKDEMSKLQDLLDKDISSLMLDA